MQDETVSVRWALRNTKAEVLKSAEEEVPVPALTSVWLDKGHDIVREVLLK